MLPWLLYQTSVSHYNIKVMLISNILYYSGTTSVNTSQYQTSMIHNRLLVYSLTATAHNNLDKMQLWGISTFKWYILPFPVDCGPPFAPQNGSLENYSNTTEGSEVFYSCDPGLVPERKMRAVCSRNGWSPNPADLSCTSCIPTCK